MRTNAPLVALMLSAALLGCAAKPMVLMPMSPLPLAWETGPSAAVDMTATAFWSDFSSPALQELLQQAAAANPDLLIAVNHLLIARNAEQAAGAHRVPSLSLDGGPVDTAATMVNDPKRRNQAVFKLALHASYELDFWGRIDHLIAAAGAQAQAQAFDLETAHISLASLVAQRYFDLGEADEVIAVLQARLALADERLMLETARHAAGRVDQSPVVAAQISAEDLQLQLLQIRQQRHENEWQLALLLGRLPGGYSLAVGPLRQQVRLPAVPAGLPSQLLQRRPDLRAADARLSAAFANIGVVYAEQFPQVRLTAELGVATDVLRNVLSGAVGLFGFGPELSLPIYDGGVRKTRLDTSQREANIAWLSYRKFSLAAFGDVERALAGRQAALDQQHRIATTEARRQQQYQALNKQFQAGRKSRLEVIAAEDQQFDSELMAIHNFRAQLDSLLAVYTALGGGWSATDTPGTP